MSHNFVITTYGFVDDQGGLHLIESPNSQLEPFYIEGEDGELCLQRLTRAFGHKAFYPEAIAGFYSHDDISLEPIRINLRNHQEFRLLRIECLGEISMGMTVEDGSLVFKESRSSWLER